MLPSSFISVPVILSQQNMRLRFQTLSPKPSLTFGGATSNCKSWNTLYFSLFLMGTALDGMVAVSIRPLLLFVVVCKWE